MNKDISKQENERQVSKSSSRPLFEVVLQHPVIFKSASIVNSRRKLRKLIQMENEIEFDEIEEGKKALLNRVIDDKYAPHVQRRLYDICLNYKSRATDPSHVQKYYKRTKEFVCNNIDDLRVKIRQVENNIKDFPTQKRAEVLGLVKRK